VILLKPPPRSVRDDYFRGLISTANDKDTTVVRRTVLDQPPSPSTQCFVVRGHEFSSFTSQSTPQNINQKTTVAMTQKQT
jgi:hypothetical protein